MSENKYPSKLLVWVQSLNGDMSAEPDYNQVFYTEREMTAFMNFLNRQKYDVRIEEHKPKLRELTRLSWFEKLAYLLPFKTQISDILVDVVKLVMGFVLGYLTKQLWQ